MSSSFYFYSGEYFFRIFFLHLIHGSVCFITKSPKFKCIATYVIGLDYMFSLVKIHFIYMYSLCSLLRLYSYTIF